ncbi:MAG: cyclic 2,3-diphosphoglycerate synthase [Candidatus Aenigmatarchaeota archaeon]|nr:cyclic 2,3-diphosphoglycerate synthase [Nanoarchaeota archaeon]
MRKKVIIMGAAGRDFHNFNVFFRDNHEYEVVCFTATQIPNIHGRTYPKELSGKLYPKGIPIYMEEKLRELIKKFKIDEVILAYSDLPYNYVMNKASEVLAAGADFKLMGLKTTQIQPKKPLISVTAIRTGSGKSQTTRRIVELLKEYSKKVVVIRHPMPYGDLVKQAVQRFAEYSDFEKHDCTIEEREEYEAHVKNGTVVYAGVDYNAILREAEKEADVIVWDGGNNDVCFYKADLYVVVADPHRPGHGLSYYPGEVNLRMADVVVINKEGTAAKENIKIVKDNIRKVNPNARIIDAASPITIQSNITGKKVLVIEDGPTLTHGEMPYGAGIIAAHHTNAVIVDPRPYAVGSIKQVYKKFTHLNMVLPAMGYGKKQIKELENIINRTKCDLVLSATPIDLSKILKVNKPIVRVTYELQELGKPNLSDVIKNFIRKFRV